MSENKPILCVDFDGVIHSYERGWQDGEVYGVLTPGFIKWSEAASKLFRLVIYSSRSKEVGGIAAMKHWLRMRIKDEYPGVSYFVETTESLTVGDVTFEFASQKPPAFLTIDDRALTFKGSWDEMDPVMLRAFKPWNAGG